VSTLLTIAVISVEKTNSLVPEQADAMGDLNSRFKRVFELLKRFTLIRVG
jgi:hypothetical protein